MRRTVVTPGFGMVALVTTALLLGGCGSSTAGDEPTAAGADRSRASADVRWGDGSYGVVLAHGAAFDAASWDEQATAIADVGATVIAVQDISPEAIADAVQALHDEGHEQVALVGGSAGSDAILELSSAQPDLADQLILLSPDEVPDGLGEQPKLFIASEDESVAGVATELAESAPGDDNKAVLLPGSAHAQNIFASDQSRRALALITERIEERA